MEMTKKNFSKRKNVFVKTKGFLQQLSMVAFVLIMPSSLIHGQKVLNMAEFGIANVEDATPITTKALKKCKEEGIGKLVFPKGTSHFYPTFAPEFYCEITNNDNGFKRTSFPMIDFHDFEIDGGGSDFIYHGKMVPFIIEESTNVKIRNLNVDWEVPFVLEGLVMATDEKNKTFDIQVKTPYIVQYGHLYLSLERADTPYERKFANNFKKWDTKHRGKRKRGRGFWHLGFL
jgi:hypothetical protein